MVGLSQDEMFILDPRIEHHATIGGHEGKCIRKYLNASEKKRHRPTLSSVCIVFVYITTTLPPVFT